MPSRLHRSCSSVDRSFSTTKQISPLGQRMIDDMAIRNMSPATGDVQADGRSRRKCVAWLDLT